MELLLVTGRGYGTHSTGHQLPSRPARPLRPAPAFSARRGTPIPLSPRKPFMTWSFHSLSLWPLGQVAPFSSRPDPFAREREGIASDEMRHLESIGDWSSIFRSKNYKICSRMDICLLRFSSQKKVGKVRSTLCCRAYFLT